MSDLEEEIVRRGVKIGTKRDRYKKPSEETRSRVLQAVEDGKDWQAIAAANGVPTQTAYGWIRRGARPQLTRGGLRKKKIENHHIQTLLDYVSNNAQISLKEMADKLFEDEGVQVTSTTIHNYLHGQFYTVKKIVREPAALNSDVNLTKRAEYVRNLMRFIGERKKIIYIDETNCNLFLRRTQGRSRRGTRCLVKVPTSKGPNVHVLGGISQTGIIHIERKRGHYKKDDCCAWLRTMLRQVHEDMDQVVVVCDNAPVHVDLSKVTEEEEFEGATLLRLGPYSAPLNPIEECWSVFKAGVKRTLAATVTAVLAPPPNGVTQMEYRLQYLESAIDESIPLLTPMLCMRTCNHVQKHFIPCLERQPLRMDDNV